MTPPPSPPSLVSRILGKLVIITLARLPVGTWLGKIGFLRRHYTARVMARRDHTGLHSGIYGSYAEAFAAVPPSRLAGWDHADSAKLWLDQIDPVRPSTYPIFFWLEKILREGTRLTDWGGSIGLTYYGYRRYSKMPAAVQWTVVEVSNIVRQGCLVAEREKAPGLSFVETLAEGGACDVVLSAGAMQYMEISIPGLLENLPSKPRHILLNKLPVTEGEECWTLHNFGPAVTPMRLYNREQLVAYFRSAGYRLADSWAVQDLDCLIPFHPERFIKEFSGYVFCLEESVDKN